LSLVETTRRTTHETYDNRAGYSLRTLRHVRAGANHRCSHDWHWCSHEWDEGHYNRLVNEHHRVWYDRLYLSKRAQERFREHAYAQRFAERINIDPHGSRVRALQVKGSPARCGAFLTGDATLRSSIRAASSSHSEADHNTFQGDLSSASPSPSRSSTGTRLMASMLRVIEATRPSDLHSKPR
jgi:hypothetical protein